jgi:hypothetical protein
VAFAEPDWIRRVDGPGGGIPISYLRAALDHIADDDDIDVVNLSLGGSQWPELEREGIERVLDAGKVVVASAGNTGDRVPQYPAGFPGVISVGATGDCVAVAEVPGFDQDRGCPGDGTAAFAADGGDPGTFTASLDSGPLDPGLRSETAAVTVDGEPDSASVAVLALEADDQAPGST